VLLGTDGLNVMPVVIVAVVVAYVTSARLAPAPDQATPAGQPVATSEDDRSPAAVH
jgi:chloride channel protein, CIC family